MMAVINGKMLNCSSIDSGRRDCSSKVPLWHSVFMLSSVLRSRDLQSTDQLYKLFIECGQQEEL
jgi:hypothetical protein